jgi:hypothetical protein
MTFCNGGCSAGLLPPPVHVDHNRALIGGIDLRCPKIEAQAVLSANRRGRATMQDSAHFNTDGKNLANSDEDAFVLVRAHPARCEFPFRLQALTGDLDFSPH